MKKHALMPP